MMWRDDGAWRATDETQTLICPHNHIRVVHKTGEANNYLLTEHLSSR